jgi:hypothetical protein
MFNDFARFLSAIGKNNFTVQYCDRNTQSLTVRTKVYNIIGSCTAAKFIKLHDNRYDNNYCCNRLTGRIDQIMRGLNGCRRLVAVGNDCMIV